MCSRFFQSSAVACLLAALSIAPLFSQEEKSTPDAPEKTNGEAEEKEAEKIEVWRGQMANLLEDPMALLPFKTAEGAKAATLRAPIAVYFPAENAAFCWDAAACRLVYGWTGETFLDTSPELNIATPGGKLRFLAAGPGNFAATVGAYGSPKYFGYKLVEGVPEFHYTLGSIAIRERITFSEGGDQMHQHFAIEGATGTITIGIPEGYEESVTTDKGSLKGRLISASATEAKSLTITFDLAEKPMPVAKPIEP